MMNKLIFWDKQTGTVYWYHDRKNTEEVAFAPMNIGDTCNLDGGGIVDTWCSEDDRQRIISKLKDC
tara:strand:+ start:284 stop:481 length:198 start_codon:yes stop_codon:yes gene_type:complete